MWIFVQNFHFPTCFCSSTRDMKLSKLDLPASKLQEWSVGKGAESAAYITVHAPLSFIKTHRELLAAKLSGHSSYFSAILLKWNNKVKKNPSDYRTPLWIFSLPIWSCGELSSCLRSLWAAWGQASTQSAEGSELCWGTKARFPTLECGKPASCPAKLKSLLSDQHLLTLTEKCLWFIYRLCFLVIRKSAIMSSLKGAHMKQTLTSWCFSPPCCSIRRHF